MITDPIIKAKTMLPSAESAILIVQSHYQSKEAKEFEYP